MAEYVYEGVDKRGQKVKGQLNAPSENDIRMLLRGQGIRPTKISTASLAQQDIFAVFKKSYELDQKELLIFTRQLQVLLGSGVSPIQAFEILEEQATSPSFGNICRSLKTRISEGSFIWEAMSKYPKSFPRLYISLVKAGESAGALDEMLLRLTSYIEDSEEVNRTVKSAMVYPVMVIIAGIIVIISMLTFVIPKFEGMLKTSGKALPPLTQMVIDASHFLQSHLLVLGVLVTGLIIGGKTFFSTQEGRSLLDHVLYRAPLFGDLMKKAGTARFCRTLSTLLNSDVNLIDAVEICRTVMDNAVLESAIVDVRKSIEQGKSLSSVLARLGVFPRMATQMMSVGESGGKLVEMLEKVSDFYEAEVQVSVQRVISVIQPLTVILLAGVVLVMLGAMYMPIFKMAEGGI